MSLDQYFTPAWAVELFGRTTAAEMFQLTIHQVDWLIKRTR